MRFRGWVMMGLLLLAALACSNSAEPPDTDDLQQPVPEPVRPVTDHAAERLQVSPSQKVQPTTTPTMLPSSRR